MPLGQGPRLQRQRQHRRLLSRSVDIFQLFKYIFKKLLCRLPGRGGGGAHGPVRVAVGAARQDPRVQQRRRGKPVPTIDTVQYYTVLYCRWWWGGAAAALTTTAPSTAHTASSAAASTTCTPPPGRSRLRVMGGRGDVQLSNPNKHHSRMCGSCL